MKKLFAIRLICTALVVVAAAHVYAAQTTPNSAAAQINWKDALKQRPEWYAGEEAVRVGDNLLLFQRDSGGWPKNIDMAVGLTRMLMDELVAQKHEDDSTIDNNATFTQLSFLARLYTAQKLERHKDAFLKGVDFLLNAQYDNGGWPQYYPLRKGYYTHITYNDGAMIGVMSLLRDIARGKNVYAFVDEGRRLRAEKSVARGVECILKTQVVVEGKRTIWGAQHDEVTLAPAAARKFEPVSLASKESVGVVRFLLEIDDPDARVFVAVESAVEWFKRAQLGGIRWVEKPDSTKPGGFERTVVKDPQAPPLWARFYEIGTNRPVFEGRDSVVRYNVSEIEPERRNGYGWYTDEPAKLLDKDYPAWRKKWRR